MTLVHDHGLQARGADLRLDCVLHEHLLREVAVDVKGGLLAGTEECPGLEADRAVLLLLEDSVDTEHVVQHLIEEHEGHAQLFLVGDLEPGLGVVPRFAPFHWDVVLAQPV